MAKKAVSKIQNGSGEVVEKWLRFTPLLYIVLAVVIGFELASVSFPVSISYLTRNELASQTSTVYAPAWHNVTDVSLRLIVIMLLLFAAFFAFVRNKAEYQKQLERRVVPLRWVGLGISLALMLGVLALIGGVHDLFTLKLIGGLVFISTLCGWLAERENKSSRRASWGAFGVGIVAAILPWLLVGATGISTVVYGMVRSSWYFYVLFGVLLMQTVALWTNLWLQIKKHGVWGDYEVSDRNYVFVDLVAKLAFVIVLIVGLHR